VEKQPSIQVGGSIESALKGDYVIDIKSVLTEAWQLTQSTRKPINLGILFVFILGVFIFSLCNQYFDMLSQIYTVIEAGESTPIDNIQSLQNNLLMTDLIITLCIWPFLAGVIMMGVFNAVGIKTHFNDIFIFLKKAAWVVLCAVIQSMLVNLGLSLFVIPGIFLLVSLSLTIPLLIDKNVTPLKAIILSIRATRFKWFQLFYIHSFLVFIFILLLIPLSLLANSSLVMVGLVIFLFGMSYLAPMYLNVKGILYREIFGLHLQVQQSSNTTFQA
jgi:hypothetical protein